MSELIRLKRVVDNAPNFIAMINITGDHPARGYILNRNMDCVFKGVENAAKYLEDRILHFHNGLDIYIIGFGWGDKYKKKASMIFPLEISGIDSKLIKTRPFLVKESWMDISSPEVKGDFLIVLGAEEIYRRSIDFETFIKVPPKIPGLEYM